MKNIIICGDLHGDYYNINKLIQSEKPTEIFQLGDFGYFPKLPKWIDYRNNLKNGNTKIHWLDGNHEDHYSIKENIRNNMFFGKNVYYMSRGSVLNLCNKNIMFIGGAFSIDREYRKLNKTYWEEEILTDNDIMNLPDIKIDIVLSHTAPSCFNLKLFSDQYEIYDPSRDVLQKVFDRYHPEKWYFGHYHYYDQGIVGGCQWICLSDTNSNEKWWERIII